MSTLRLGGLVAALALALALALPAAVHAQPAPVRIILVGDSTVASRSGWGDAFCADAAPQVTCINVARGGRSSGSFRAEGSWKKVMDQLAEKGPWTATYVFIQFGHNDQPGKPGRSTDFATEFGPNLAGYVADVRAAGARPVLVTPLARRQFRNGLLQDGLAGWAARTRKVAAETGAPLIDLHGDSVIAVQAMGPVAAMDLAMEAPPAEVREAAASGTTVEVNRVVDSPSAPADAAKVEPQGRPKTAFDYTHIGSRGAALFARMVEAALPPELAAYFTRPRAGPR